MTYSAVSRILAWYQTHERDLPWRRTRDPYKIYISEVMLQQTQVERVLPKYRAFVKQFPTVRALAGAPISAVLRAWAGLGYNRRALYAIRCAQKVIENFHGRFPRTFAELKTLPGVGEYTARAILSFAFAKPVAALDANHRRVLHRILYGLPIKRRISDKQLLKDAEKILPRRSAYDWNQALMDFGSLICVNAAPKCDICPVQKFCKAFPQIAQARKRGESLGRFVRPQASFRTSNRYFRGRILDALRARSHTFSSLKHSIKIARPETTAVELKKCVSALAAEGLAQVRAGKISLPQ